MTEELQRMYTEHPGKVSDKWSVYLEKYDSAFNDYKDKAICLLEIGVQNGGSLEVWSRFFPNARKIIGCDINQQCALLEYEDPRISVVAGDANTDDTQAVVLQKASLFDVIIDDGSHVSGDIVRSFARYFPVLEDGGIFIVEDLHCSYWQEYEGGLFYPFSSMSFFKRITDIINYEHWGTTKKPSDIFGGFSKEYQFEISDEILQHIHSIEFINSMCIIKKRMTSQNKLGARIIAGSIDTVVPGLIDLHLTQTPTPTQTDNKWTARGIAPDEELLVLLTELTECNKQISALNKTITDIQSSLSWRITRPLRIAANKVRSIKNPSA